MGNYLAGFGENSRSGPRQYYTLWFSNRRFTPSTALAVELQSYGCAPCEATTVESKPGKGTRLASDIIGSCEQQEYLPRAITRG